MTQPYKKVRPSRAARARQKTRTPNIPDFTGPEDWDRPTQAPAAKPALSGNFVADGPRPVSSAFSRAARSASIMEVTQDYSYLKKDLIRIATTTISLLVIMVAFAFWYHMA